MKSYQKEVCYIAAVALIAVAGAALLMGTGGHMLGDRNTDHGWLHDRLSMTVEQDRALAALEARFVEQKAGPEAEIRAANQVLAEAIWQDRRYSERVGTAVERVHRAQGELQKLSIQHIFEMQNALEPSQIKKLHELVADALAGHP